jgi:hypothetical protein
MKNITKEEFILRASKYHNYEYNYSKVKFLNTNTKINIYCNLHGVFTQTPTYHLTKYGGCKKCRKKTNSIRKQKVLISDFNKIHHNKYDYSEVKFVNTRLKVKIKCKIHGIFEQSPCKHLLGQGCIKCSYNKEKSKPKMYLKHIQKAKIVHKNKYTYLDDIKYETVHKKIDINCPKHGKFKQSLHNHIKHNQGCPMCSYSKAEIVISNFLKDNKIKFYPQHKFINCINKKTGKKLKFDFYIPSENLCIEYDGEQHYKPMRLSDENVAKEKLKNIKIRDEIKNEYCKENNINLLRIHFKHYKKLKYFLEKELLDKYF